MPTDEDEDRTEALAGLVMEHLQKAVLPPNVKRLSNMKAEAGMVWCNVEFSSGTIERFRLKVDHRHDSVHGAVKTAIDFLGKQLL